MGNIKELEKLLKLGVISQEVFDNLKKEDPVVKRTHVNAPSRMNKILKDNFDIDLPKENKKPLKKVKWNYEPAKELVKEEEKIDKNDHSREAPTELEELLFNLKKHKEEKEPEEINKREGIEVDEPISEDELPTVEQIEEEISNEANDYLHEDEIVSDPEETKEEEMISLDDNTEPKDLEVGKEIENSNSEEAEEKEVIKPVNPPRGWHLRKDFIDDVGNIFHKGQYVGKKLDDEE